MPHRDQRLCAHCGSGFTVSPNSPKLYCSRVCANRATSQRRRTPRSRTMVRAPTDSRSSRKARERDAPGLGYSARKTLRDKWVAQGRRCTYCTRPATTLDHVVPLVRGGTNHEGNITPCCKWCNSSKAGWTVIEWRTGRRLPPMTSPLPWTYVLRRQPRTATAPPAGQQLAYDICDICGSLTVSKTCSYACHQVRMRNRYRARVGIPLDAPLHTRAS
jgi:hypothetical protein